MIKFIQNQLRKGELVQYSAELVTGCISGTTFLGSDSGFSGGRSYGCWHFSCAGPMCL